LQPGQVIELPAKIKTDLRAFASAVSKLNATEQLKAMGRIAEAYALNM